MKTDIIEGEVFVVGIDVSTALSGPLNIFKSYEEVLDHLNNLNPVIDSDTKVLHGILTSAEVLPSSFNNSQPFIIIKDPNDDEIGSIIEIEDDNNVEDLADKITGLIVWAGNIEISCTPEIDNIFVLYGYEVDMVLSITEDNMDEQQIEEGKEILNSIKKIKTISNK